MSGFTKACVRQQRDHFRVRKSGCKCVGVPPTVSQNQVYVSMTSILNGALCLDLPRSRAARRSRLGPKFAHTARLSVARRHALRGTLWPEAYLATVMPLAVALRRARTLSLCSADPVPLWVNLTMRRSLPVYPRKQTFSEPVGMSQRCHRRKSALSITTSAQHWGSGTGIIIADHRRRDGPRRKA
jgi:hypothetical protein